ncbi:MULTISPECIES: tyrosine-type recombinase/integrase [unclassified Moraxella]|uniref:tyrosine-type recombinase/integrase n=1 Tax=unclassified Moraxella TaxID=2685852 RepID=UPI003AF9A789
MSERKTISTDRSISSHKAEDKEYLVGVSQRPNLFLMVRPNGTKSWIFRYTSPINGKRQRISLGVYPSISLARAGELWQEYTELLSKNIDPKSHREQVKQNIIDENRNTFDYFSQCYFKTIESTLADNTINRKRNHIALLCSYLGDMPISEISSPKMLEVLLDIQQHSLQANGVPTQKAERCASIASDIFTYAITRGHCINNPAMLMKSQLDKPRYGHRPAIIKPLAFGQLLRDIESIANKVDANTITSLRLLPLLFVRNGDLRHMKWGDIDFEESKWRFQPMKGKGRENMVHEMVVPLSKQAIEILKHHYQFTGHTDYVFHSTSAKKKGVISDVTANNHLKELGYKDIHCVHGFRASAKTMLQEQLKYPAVIVEMGLGHITKDQNGTAYGRFEFLDDRIEMMQTWADYLDALRNEEDTTRFKNRLQGNTIQDPAKMLEILANQMGKESLLKLLN